MGKGEIARYEQFLLFPQCFQKSCSQGRQKVSLCGNGLNREDVMVGKGENAGYKHLLLFPLCFQKAFPQRGQKLSFFGEET